MAAASDVRGDGGAESFMSWQQLLILFIFGGGCTVRTGTAYVFPRRIRHGWQSKTPKINAMVTLNSNADEALKQQSTERGHPLSNGLGRWGGVAGRWSWRRVKISVNYYCISEIFCLDVFSLYLTSVRAEFCFKSSPETTTVKNSQNRLGTQIFCLTLNTLKHVCS